MTNINIHNVVKTEVEEMESKGHKWVKYTFTDKDGNTVEVVAFK